MLKKIIRKIYRVGNKIPYINCLFEILIRLKLAKTYDKKSFNPQENIFEHIYSNNIWCSDESRSGGGSELAATVTLRKKLPEIWKKYNIKTFIDVPCGDFNWMKEVDKTGIDYLGGDIVEETVKENSKLFSTENIKFEKIDITKDILPKVDMIFCKDCLQHLSYENITKALKNFMKSGSKYLMVTSYPLTLKNYDIFDGDYRALNLFIKPISLQKKYKYKIREKSKGIGIEIDKTMYILEISDLLS